ncbi:MAG: M23 family metallopeptidase, partial [Thalassolituus sp.]
GYGNLVEVNHGNGYKTRYAHCKEIEVNVGDIVRKGDIIALMGSTGRSTGPHVHFEVYKNGRSVDPAAYIHRRPR